MAIWARAPGKLVVLGEYAVLHGAPALVMAVSRYSEARIAPSEDGRCHLETFAPARAEHTAAPGRATGVALVDRICAAAPGPPWRGSLDSRPLYDGACKLGLGSSAAALCAWAGAWRAYAGASRDNGWQRPQAAALIALHRDLQGGVGSGLDVAASLTGGLIEFRLTDTDVPYIGSVQVPNSVGFAGIFAGSSASTPDFVSRYRAWRTEHPGRAARQDRVWGTIAEAGCIAAREDDAEGFLTAVREYGRCLESLGEALGAEIVTAEHRAIGREAKRYGVVYKVSGAGGGDLGVAAATDVGSLNAFKAAVAAKGYRVIDFRLDQQGLVVEERAQ
jgi:phosphomevalonate kinase